MKVENGLYYWRFWDVVVASRCFLEVILTTELQCAADGDRVAVDIRAVVESEEAGGMVVGKGVLCAVNADRTEVCRAVVLP